MRRTIPVLLLSWVTVTSLNAQSPFIRGDATGNGTVDLEDAVYGLRHLFSNGPAICRSAIDTDASGTLGLIDPLYLLGYLFLNGPPPLTPFPGCASEPDALGCEAHPFCAPPPDNLTYSSLTATYFVGVPARNVPSYDGGPPDHYKIDPDLPDGLEIDPQSGVIAGIPTTPTPPTDYTVTASNNMGSASVDLTLGVEPPPSLLPHGFYVGPSLYTPRYGHTATRLMDGRVLIVGGSDERYLTSLDTATVYDPDLSPTGGFVDTDIAGNPIALAQGGRVYHTANLLGNGTVLVAGGTRDILVSEATPVAEIFDPQTRTFSDVAGEMVTPRFRHTATFLFGSRILIAGGQRSVSETIIDPNFPPGHPLFQVNVETFPSTDAIEFFDPVALEFRPATDISGNPTELVTPRGRSGLATARIAGMDSALGTGDDIVVHVGGYQTLSSIFAPLTKFPNQLDLDLMQGVEYLDRSTFVNASAAGINTLERANQPNLVNLGTFRPVAVDGVPGVNNVLLVTHGDDNGLCRVSQPASELISVVFTGQGPSNGIQFGYQSSTTHLMNIELVTFDPGAFSLVGRSEAPAIIMPTERIYNGQRTPSNWVVTVGGAHLTCPATGPRETLQSVVPNTHELSGIMFFDPFYHAGTAPPWDQSLNRNTIIGLGGIDLNSTGVVGTWLNGDSLIPDDSLVEFAGPELAAVTPLVALHSPRAYHTLTAVAGPDGIAATFDDWLLIVGGGTSVLQEGGEPTALTCEIYVPPQL